MSVNQEKTLCFMLQARVGSTRLPKKMILPFYDKRNILQLIIEKLKNSFPEIPIVLATSADPSNDELENLAFNLNCKVYRGSEEDVLYRFILAAEKFNFNNIIRVCADNPFLDIKEMKHLVNFINKNHNFDYVSFKINGRPSIKSHFGFWAEYITLKTLKNVNNSISEKLYHEHVTNFIYENPNRFKINYLDANSVLKGHDDIRMTLDTLEDFTILSEIYSKLNSKYSFVFGINEIVDFLDNNPGYKVVMKNQIAINSK